MFSQLPCRGMMFDVPTSQLQLETLWSQCGMFIASPGFSWVEIFEIVADKS